MADQFGINLGEVYANVDAIQTAKLRNQLLQGQMSDANMARQDRNTLRSVAPAAMRGDANALSTYAGIDPEGAMRLQSWAEGQDEKQKAKSTERIEYAGNVLNFVMNMPEEQQAQGWADAIAMASEDDPEMGAAMKKLMPQYDPRKATMLMARTSHAAEMIAGQKASRTASDVDSAIRGVNQPKMVERERVSTVPASMIRQELMARGLPEHVAEGFVLNMQDESGLNPGINEKNPIVEGSRGGFGLYQLTGPRRVAYEQWASKHGRALDDPSAQLDFLAMELEGPERAAADKIMATSTPGEAASAIATYFLRPSKEHLAARVEKYMQADPSQPQTSQMDLIALKARPDLTEQQQNAINLVLGMMQPPEPMSPEGKLEADRRNGLVGPQEPKFRQATPEEASVYGAVSGQFDNEGKFYPMEKIPEAQPPAANFEAEGKMRGEFAGLPPIKNFMDQSDAMSRIAASASDPSPAGDLSLIFGYMKMLDPGSVVRESEFATAATAAPLLERLGISWDKVSGVWEGKKLTPGQRKDFVTRADAIYQGAVQQYSALSDQYRGFAQARGLDPERSVPTFGFQGQLPEMPGDEPTGDPMGQPSGPVPVANVDEYNALPPGTPYIDPNGRAGVKR